MSGSEAASRIGKKPLAGIRVLEMASYIAGPYCCTLMAEFGAEVIKIELPGVGEAGRYYGTKSAAEDATFMFLSENRNKKSITIDLRTPEGVALLKRLVRLSDVVVENFQPGTLESWGAGWEDLRAENARLIMARITGFGQTGPAKDRPGFGRIGVAFGGLGFLTGYPDRAPTSPGTATLADYLSGLFASNGVLLALRARDAHGIGQFIDLGIYEAVFRILDEVAPVFHATGKVRERTGPASANSVPHSNFESKDHRWIGIACTSDKIFARLARAMGKPELAAADRWATYAARRAEAEAVNACVTAWTTSLNRDDILRVCEEYQVASGAVYAIDEIFADAHYAARENLLKLHDSRVGDVVVPNVVPRLSETPGVVESLGPSLGAHNREVFEGLLGMTSAEIGALASRKII